MNKFRYRYTAEQKDFIIDGYAKMPIAELTAKFNARFGTNKTRTQLKGILDRYGIRCGRDPRFKKGQVSHLKGTKGIVKPNKGNFKKGHTPANKHPLGHERVCPKDGYVLVKTGKGKLGYTAKHIIVWEKANGPVPKDKVILLKDGDPLNCKLDNLELMSKQEVLRLNIIGYSKLPNELRPTMRIVAKLEAKTFSLKNNLG